MTMKNEKPDDDAKIPDVKRPEHGADSQLHCYNAVSWRLAEMFGEQDDPLPGPPKQRSSR